MNNKLKLGMKFKVINECPDYRHDIPLDTILTIESLECKVSDGESYICRASYGGGDSNFLCWFRKEDMKLLKSSYSCRFIINRELD